MAADRRIRTNRLDTGVVASPRCGSFACIEGSTKEHHVTVRSAARGDGAVPAPAPSHPLQRLGADEIRLARTVLAGHELVGEHTRFAYLGLEEPPKPDVLGFRDGDPVERRVRAILLDSATGAATDVVASLTRGTVDSRVAIDTARDGQPPVMLEDLMAVGEVVKADAGWRAAMARRGVTDLGLVRPCPLSAGSFGVAGEEGRRMLRVLSFVQHHEQDHPWAHPVDGLVAYVDLIERRVVELVDAALLPIPQEEGNFDDPAAVGPVRTSLKPIEISQPEGPSFTVDGDEVSWEGWRLRIGFDAREGLTLHQVSLWDRPVVYRASVSEMVVPYADPSPARFWQNYFDAGEYLLGQQVNSLMLGCDCLGEIRYFDVVLPTQDGEPREVPNAICMHEEDVGVAWKHTDLFTGSAETRRQRRLVISTFVAIGNYDYGFYWYLYLDGSIELQVKATGVMFTSSYAEGSRWATQVAPGLGAPYHQHFFSARLDMTVDGVDNAVDEVELQRLPVGPDNPYGNAFTRRVTRLGRESEGARTADASVGRAWHVVNPGKTNRFGQPVAYALYPEGTPLLAADETASISGRAAFATRHLWVTRYDPAQRYAAGDLPNQHPGGAGLPAWTTADRDIDGSDIVLWHTFGMTHFPRTEDWPVTPVVNCGFTLRPVGFFDRNPILDLPR
jgi:primary-amine oxidase